MSILSLFDDSFKTLLNNAINLKYLSVYGYSNRYSYMEDNILNKIQKDKLLVNDNIRFIKSNTINKINNIWLIGYKDYSIVDRNFFDTTKINLDTVYVGKSITPTLIGECETIDFTNIIFNTSKLTILNKPDTSYYDIFKYYSEILNGYIEACGDEDLYNKKYSCIYLFDKYIFNRLHYVNIASVYHFYNIFHNSNIKDTILPNIEYSQKNEEESIYNIIGMDINEFEKFVDKVKYYLGKI